MQEWPFTNMRRITASRERGIALIVVLLTIAVLAALVFEFCHESRLKYQLAENTLHSYQALYCAEAGLALALAALEQNNSLWSDEKLAAMLSGAVEVPVGPGYCTASVVGERGKINVNGLVTRAGRPVRQHIDQMFRLIDALNRRRAGRDPISYSLVPAIMDWIDPDSEVTVLSYVQGANAGAEDEYYQNLEKPYHCKNGPLDVLSELMFVKGMTREIFDGGAGTEHANATTGMSECLTVYGPEGMVNVNEASAVVLQTLSEQMDPVLAESIIRHRPYQSVEELARVPGMTREVLQAIRGLVTVQPGGEFYTVTARGVVGNCVRTIRVAVRRGLSGGRVIPLVRWEM
jgi:general secretion pathway protein K